MSIVGGGQKERPSLQFVRTQEQPESTTRGGTGSPVYMLSGHEETPDKISGYTWNDPSPFHVPVKPAVLACCVLREEITPTFSVPCPAEASSPLSPQIL